MTGQELLAIAKPILFNTKMTAAILDNHKTVTRRVVNPQPEICCDDGFIYDKIANNLYCKGCGNPFINSKHKECMPKHQVGDYLYVRETWCWCPCWDCGMNIEIGCYDDTADRFYNDQKKENGCYGYKASFETGELPFDKWLPSIHMPKEAARIFLLVTDVRVERLQDITIDGVEHEGIPLAYPIVKMIDSKHLKAFISLWNSTIKKQDLDRYGWSANPWVWAIEFERVETDG